MRTTQPLFLIIAVIRTLSSIVLILYHSINTIDMNNWTATKILVKRKE